MTDSQLKEMLDAVLRRGSILCFLFGLLCAVALVAEHLGRTL